MKPNASRLLARSGVIVMALWTLVAHAADRHHGWQNPGRQQSGITGHAVISPNVSLDGVILDGSPVQTSVAVYTAKGRFVATFNTDADGVFEVALKPASYVLVPNGLSNPFLTPVHTAVTVRQGDFAVVTVGYYDPPL